MDYYFSKITIMIILIFNVLSVFGAPKTIIGKKHSSDAIQDARTGKKPSSDAVETGIANAKFSNLTKVFDYLDFTIEDIDNFIAKCYIAMYDYIENELYNIDNNGKEYLPTQKNNYISDLRLYHTRILRLSSLSNSKSKLQSIESKTLNFYSILIEGTTDINKIMPLLVLNEAVQSMKQIGENNRLWSNLFIVTDNVRAYSNFESIRTIYDGCFNTFKDFGTRTYTTDLYFRQLFMTAAKSPNPLNELPPTIKFGCITSLLWNYKDYNTLMKKAYLDQYRDIVGIMYETMDNIFRGIQRAMNNIIRSNSDKIKHFYLLLMLHRVTMNAIITAEDLYQIKGLLVENAINIESSSSRLNTTLEIGSSSQLCKNKGKGKQISSDMSKDKLTYIKGAYDDYTYFTQSIKDEWVKLYPKLQEHNAILQRIIRTTERVAVKDRITNNENYIIMPSLYGLYATKTDCWVKDKESTDSLNDVTKFLLNLNVWSIVLRKNAIIMLEDDINKNHIQNDVDLTRLFDTDKKFMNDVLETINENTNVDFPYI